MCYNKLLSSLRLALSLDLKERYGFDSSTWQNKSAKDLKTIDKQLLHVLDTCENADRLKNEYPSTFAMMERNALHHLRTYLNYSYKVKVEPSKTQIREAVTGFLERNNACRSWTKNNIATLKGVYRNRHLDCINPSGDPTMRLLSYAKFLVHQRTYCYREPGLPSHGPGVASNCSSIRIRKYEALGRDVAPSLRRFSDYLVASPSFLSEFLPLGWDSVCKLRGVPKDARGPRLIAPHSVTHMWMQQAIRDRLSNILVRQEQWYKYHILFDQMVSTIQFDDQQINQGLALYASSHPGMYATLDLSDASDRIPWSLVEVLVPRRLRRDLTAVRARYISIDSKLHRLYMHAPMGSATCFPVLSLVVWAISCAAILCAKLSNGTLAGTNPSHYGSRFIPSDVPGVFVFGDDVILPTEYADHVYAALELCNLKVNRDKSYTGPGGFRESCGCDAYQGVEITPLRLKVAGVSSVQDLATLISHRNAAMRDGLTRLAKQCETEISLAAAEIGVAHLIGATDDPLYTACLTMSETDAKRWNRAQGVVSRWNRRLQRREIRVFAFVNSVSTTSSDLDSRSRLFEGLLGNRARPAMGWSGNRPRLSVMWIPIWYARK